MQLQHVVGLAIALILFNFAPPVCADNSISGTGNELISICNQHNYEVYNAQWLYCIGYVAGVGNGFILGVTYTENVETKVNKRPESKLNQAINILTKLCPPDGITQNQMGLVVSKYLHDNPDKLNELSYVIALHAMQDAWPCPGVPPPDVSKQ